MRLTPEQIQEAITKAKAKLNQSQPVTRIELKPPNEVHTKPISSHWVWNSAQQEAITNGVIGKSFVLIGAAGTGKTTTLRGMLKEILQQHAAPMLKRGTQYLSVDTPGIVLVSFTRRAVRNIAKQMPEELKSHCLTIHKLLEFAPERYEDYNDKGEMVTKLRFVPTRHSSNPLPNELIKIFVDESSMVSWELFDLLCNALPNPGRVQFVFLGDLNQLPPVYGHPILGKKLTQLPIVELTEVYRQALESPIISLALAVKNNNFAEFNKQVVDLWTGDRFTKPDGKKNYLGFDLRDLTGLIDKDDKKKPAALQIHNPGRGKVTLQVWKSRVALETGLAFMQGQLKNWIDTGYYNPDEDLVLCPWNKSFGTDELNRAIADKLGKNRGAEIHEIIAGYQKYYYAVGDKLLVDKQEALVIRIQTNPKYYGTPFSPASKDMDRWGNHAVKTAKVFSDFEGVDIDALMEQIGDVQDRKEQASHQVVVRLLDSDEEVILDKAAQFNATSFGYAITVHKAQGSECRKVFFLSHYCHSAMMYRELVYTALTRAAEELHVICTPMALGTAAKRPRIKGETLEAKVNFYREKIKEKLDTDEGENDNET